MFVLLTWFLSTVTNGITIGLFRMLHGLVYMNLFLCLSYKVGWIDRFIWYIAEKEASKILNNTPVTIGSLLIDWNWFQGKVIVSVTNVIIHTPHRDIWQWESPLIVRIGYASIEANLILTVLNLILFHKEIPIEVYTAQISDIQIFVERQRNIFNFYLMDKCMILPNPNDLLQVSGGVAVAESNTNNNNNNTKKMGSSTTTTGTSPSSVTTKQNATSLTNNTTNTTNAERHGGRVQSQEDQQQNHPQTRPLTVDPSTSGSSMEGDNPPKSQQQQQHERNEQQQQSQTQLSSLQETSTTTMTNNNNIIGTTDSVNEEKAQQLVHDMLKAVKILGRAAKKNGLKDALHQQGQTLATKLRTIPKPGKGSLAEGVTLMHHVGKVAVESLKSSKLDQLVPQRIPSGKPPPVARVGRIVLKQVRIFTRDSWIRQPSSISTTTTNSNNNNATTTTTPTTKTTTTNTTTSTMTTNNNKSAPGTIVTSTSGSVNNNNAKKNNSSTTTGNKTSSSSTTPTTTSTSSGMTAGWNRPITIQEVVIRAAELCPPMSLTDEEGLPVIYLPVDKLGEVVWRRVLAEMAKTNTGRLFQTAVGEALAFMKTSTSNNNNNSAGNNTSSKKASSTTTATTTTTTTSTTTTAAATTTTSVKV